MTCTLKIFKSNKLVNIKNIGELNALKQLSIILLRDKICGIKSDVSYYYDENGYLVVAFTLKIEDYTYYYMYKGLNGII